MAQMAILGQKWSFLTIFRGFHGVTLAETLGTQRSTHLPHNIQNSALNDEKWENGGPKAFAIPYVNVPFSYNIL